MGLDKLVVGLTGGIGSGKSLVTELFNQRSARTLDADEVVAQLYEHDRQLGYELFREFGWGIFTTDTKIDRKKLGNLVFSDEKKLSRLEEIVWPRVQSEIGLYIASQRGIIIIEAARMYESESHKRYDKTILVDAKPATQIKRLVEKRGLDQPKAKQIIDLQQKSMQDWPASDYTIKNDAEVSAPDYQPLRDDVDRVWRSLLRDYHAKRCS